jgi:hypothetical protein
MVGANAGSGKPHVEGTSMTRNRSVVATVLCFAVLLSATGLHVHRVGKTIPYPQHVDEMHLTERAAKMMTTGDLNPKFFHWPTYPIYLTAAAMTAGYLIAASQQELWGIDGIGSVSYPYYSHPTIVWPVKLMFLLMAVATAGLLGVVAVRLTGEPALLVLTPLVICLSDLFFGQMQIYPNVDTVGALSVACLYLFHILYFDCDTMMHKAVLPGVLSGMVIASKYSLHLILLTSIVVILLQSKRPRIAQIVLFFAVAVVTFVLLVPFSVLDLPVFLDDVAGQAFHYAYGHPGYERPSGVSHLFAYFTELLGDFGVLTVPFFLIGSVALIRRSWRHALVVGLFPVVHLVYFSWQRTHFSRNVVFVYLMYATAAAVGVVVAYRWIVDRLDRFEVMQQSPGLRRASAIVGVGIAVAVCFPVGRPIAWAREQPDARHLAVQWIRENVSTGSALFIPRELALDTRPLEDEYEVTEFRLMGSSTSGLVAEARELGDPYILMPRLVPVHRLIGTDSWVVESVDTANGHLRLLDVAIIMGEHEVLVDELKTVARNPEILIGTLGRRAKERQPADRLIRLDIEYWDGRKEVMLDGGLRLPWRVMLQSPALDLDPGRYELVMVTRGTELDGENALFNVYLDDRSSPVASFFATTGYQETRIPIVVDGEAPTVLFVEFANNLTNERGDRDAYIKSISLLPLDDASPGTAAARR